MGLTHAVGQWIASEVSPDIQIRGETPLMMAASGLNVETLQFLIRCGADANLINLSGNSALGYVAYSEIGPDYPDAVVECVKALLLAGADPHLRNSEGQSQGNLLAVLENPEVDQLLGM